MSESVTIDFSRGFDVFRGSKLIAHFDGAGAYEAAKAKAAEGPGRYVRYWGIKPQPEGE